MLSSRLDCIRKELSPMAEYSCTYSVAEHCLEGTGQGSCGLRCMRGYHKPIPEFVTKDSGERENFDTGSRRDSREGKGRFDLLPFRAIRRVAKVLERGAAKYGPRNWELGQPQSRYLDSALRHLADYAEGKRDEDHLAQAGFNVLALIDQEERRDKLPEELFDIEGQ